MASTRSKKAPLFQISLLTTLLGVAGCASIHPATSVEGSNSTPSTTSQAVTTSKKPAPVVAAADKPAAGVDDQGDQLLDAHLQTDLWERIRAGYGLPALDSPLVARHEQWFINNPEYLESMVGRARLYLYYIVEEVEKRGMPMEIALLPAIESAYKPQAYSRSRAAGLWQFIPSTGRIYGLEMNWWYDGRNDVMASTGAALDYLEKLHAQFNDWQLALAAYNCGERKVERLMQENQRKGLPTDYSSLKKLPKETKNYVPKLMAMANIIADPAKYGVQIAAIPNTEYFARVETDGQIDLGVVAKLTDMPVDELFMINPGYQRWITDPNGPHALLVPADKKDALIEGLAKLNDEDRVQWARHQVRRGDTMSRVAVRYNVTVESIRTANSLSNNHLTTGQNLLIPVSANKLSAIPPAAIVKAANAGTQRETGDSERVKIVHRVRSGETLWSIARKYKVYIHQLREWNLLEAEDNLRLGQRLFIWTTHGSDTSAANDLRSPG
jgi:membrane-bound lytic murein transglycosylase D